MEAFIFISLLMLAGYSFNKFNIFPKETPNVLNKYIVYVSLPAMVLLYVPQINFSGDIFVPITISWIVTLCGALTIYILSKILNWHRDTTGTLMLVAVLGNTSFLGIPIVNYYYGANALPYVMIYDQLGSFLALSTYGAVVVAIYSQTQSLNVTHILKKVITFPPFVALIIAFLLHGIEFSQVSIKILTQLANTLVPIALISVGFSLQLKIPKEDIWAFVLGLSTKLIIIPIFAIIFVSLFGYEGLVANVSILEAGMGPMITAGILASMSGFSKRLSSSIVGYGVILSFFTTAFLVEIVK